MDSLLTKDLNEDTYNEYIEKLINIFKLSTKESSIIFNLKIKESKCLIKLSIVNQNGEKEEFRDKTFKCDELFYKEFLNILIKRFVEEIDVIKNDIVNLDEDEFVTLRIITNNNDLFLIDGLNDTKANYLKNICEEEKIINFSEDEMGIGSLKIFTLIIFIFIIIILTLIFMFIK